MNTLSDASQLKTRQLSKKSLVRQRSNRGYVGSYAHQRPLAKVSANTQPSSPFKPGHSIYEKTSNQASLGLPKKVRRKSVNQADAGQKNMRLCR